MEPLLEFEAEARSEGYRRVAGVDEVGRGPLAGPVVACAVILPANESVLEGLTDSKQLCAARRKELAGQLQLLPGITIGAGVVSPADIDRLNILRATHQAMLHALGELDPPADYILVDGRPVPGLPAPSRAIVKGDALSASIAAASILAKVIRDAMMVDFEETYPGYGFAAHKGYGTAEHLAALERLGPCPIHRVSFAPVQRCLPGALRQGTLDLGA